jgi:hypothetical protein
MIMVLAPHRNVKAAATASREGRTEDSAAPEDEAEAAVLPEVVTADQG